MRSLGIEPKHVSLSSLYCTCDWLVAEKEAIGHALVQRERELFGLGEKIILYDLTNTYFESNPGAQEAQRGASKDKRTYRPLITLAMILDEEGFPKTSKVYPGNVSEPSAKENPIKNRFQMRFEQDLQNLADSLGKKGGIKKYERVLERIGRLGEKYHLVARFDEIRIEHKNGQALRLSWQLKDAQGLEQRFSGRYRLRSSRRDLSDTELWKLYNMLTQMEASFRSLKQELSLRPVYHRISQRIQGHVFVTVLADHLLCVIQRALHTAGIHHYWTTLCRHLSGQVRVTTSMTNNKGQIIRIRYTSEPEPVHLKIYQALGIRPRSLRRVMTIE